MKTIIFCMLALLAGFLMGTVYTYKDTSELCDTCRDSRTYVIAAESLLDSLDNEYHWSDACDPQDYYASIENLTNHKFYNCLGE